jgi:hypothetical protein
MADMVRIFSDDTTDLLGSIVQAVLAAGMTTGALLLGGLRPVAVVIAVTGLIWLLVAATWAVREAHRIVLLRSAVPASATILSVRRTNLAADDYGPPVRCRGVVDR